MKTKRQETILHMIRSMSMQTQAELVDSLKQAGFDVTQATVSRDIKELGLIKIAGPGGQMYYAAGPVDKKLDEERLQRLFRESVLSYEASENIVVVRTPPGEAQMLALALDQSQWPEVAGTVSGDDTFLIVARPGKTDLVMGRLDKLKGVY